MTANVLESFICALVITSICKGQVRFNYIKEYIATLINYLLQSYKDMFERIKINIDVESLLVLIDIAIPLGLMN